MLAAVLHGKAARVSVEGKDVSWRELFRQREDLLTAAFFGRFLYLSRTGRQQALALLVNSHIAEGLGDIKDVVFWPSLWQREEDGGGRVEPDVIITCENGSVMVEVKPPWGKQHEGQWANEVKALRAAVKIKTDVGFELSDNIHFVALGQNLGLDIQKFFECFDTEGCFELEAHQREWIDILKGVDGWAELENNNDRAVVTDWRELFDLFGIRRPIRPFSDMLNLLPVLDDSLALLAKMRRANSETEPQLSLLTWHSLLLLSNRLMENPECKSLLKKLASS